MSLTPTKTKLTNNGKVIAVEKKQYVSGEIDFSSMNLLGDQR